MEPHLLQREANQAASSAVLDAKGRSLPSQGLNVMLFVLQLLGPSTEVTRLGD
jgi:hypothetical protein